MAHGAEIESAPACRNCGAALHAAPLPRFCPQCGQATQLHPPSLGEFMHEFIGHYVALEGVLWKSLALLLFRPGRLTAEYLAGRRRRYVLPLRLYLSASFVFFLVVKLLPDSGANDINVVTAPPVAAAAAASAAAEPPDADLEIPLSAFACERADCNRLQQAAARAEARWRDNPQQARDRFVGQFRSNLPYTIFLMLPVFAAIVMLAYRRRGMVYGEHVVFGLHMHSFWFLAALLLTLLPAGISEFGLLVVLAYGALALRTVYGGRWRPTLLRALFISVVYGLSLVVGMAALSIALLLV
jgi:hypothetical protein